jgi:hypothetical protein
MGKSVKALVAVVVLFGAAAGISYATTAVTRTATSVLQACANDTNGNLRLVGDSATDCRTHETGVSWNVVGPAGPPGADGKDGKDGVNGTNGADGKDGADGVSPTVRQLAVGDPACPTGGAAITDAAGTVANVCNGAAGADGSSFTGTFGSPDGRFSLKVADTGIELRGPLARITLDPTSLDLRADTSLAIRSGLNLQLEGILSTLKGSQVTIGSNACAPPLRQGDSMFVNVPAVPGTFPVTVVPSTSVVCLG